MRKTKFRVKHYRDHKRPKLKFVVSGRENGKRTRRFFETKTEAESYAQAKNIELHNKGVEAINFPTRLRQMAQECDALLQEHNRTLKDATEFYLRHLAAVKKSCTASGLVQQVLTAKEKDGAGRRHLEDLRSRLDKFAEHFNGKMVAEITTADIDDWLRSLPVHARTRNNFRRVVINALNFAVHRGYATENPAKETAKARAKDAPIGILTVEQTARLLETAEGDMLAYCAIGAFAGLRRSEIVQLDWSEIDFESDLIEVTAQKSKTAQRRHVTLQPNLRQWLLPLRKHSGLVVAVNYGRRLVATRRRAGLTDWPQNALRHSFGSCHLAHFKNGALTALEMGHTDARVTFRHYRELVKPKEAERFWKIRPAATEKIVSMEARA